MESFLSLIDCDFGLKKYSAVGSVVGYMELVKAQLYCPWYSKLVLQSHPF